MVPEQIAAKFANWSERRREFELGVNAVFADKPAMDVGVAEYEEIVDG